MRYKSQLGGGASLVIFKLFATTAPATQSIIRRYCSLVLGGPNSACVPALPPTHQTCVGWRSARGDHHADVRHSWRVAAPGVRPGLRRAAAAAPPTAPAPTRSHRPRRRRILPRPGPQGLAGERGGDPGPSPFPSPGVGQALALTPTLFYAGCPGRASCGAQGLPRDGTRPLRPVGEGVPRLTLALTLPRLTLTLTLTLTRRRLGARLPQRAPLLRRGSAHDLLRHPRNFVLLRR